MALCFASGARVSFLMKSTAAHCWRLSGRMPACLTSLQGLRGDTGIIQEPRGVGGKATGQCHYLFWTLGTRMTEMKTVGTVRPPMREKPRDRNLCSKPVFHADRLSLTMHGIWAERAPSRCLSFTSVQLRRICFPDNREGGGPQWPPPPKEVKVFPSSVVLNLGNIASK